MFRQMIELFRQPSAKSLAQRELEQAQRELLQAQTAAEYASRMSEYHNDRIQRLQAFLKENR
jgi:predicted glycosyl hydrolase (DUF1957 family)